jgi:hypothetical protein
MLILIPFQSLDTASSTFDLPLLDSDYFSPTPPPAFQVRRVEPVTYRRISRRGEVRNWGRLVRVGLEESDGGERRAHGPLQSRLHQHKTILKPDETGSDGDGEEPEIAPNSGLTAAGARAARRAREPRRMEEKEDMVLALNRLVRSKSKRKKEGVYERVGKGGGRRE